MISLLQALVPRGPPGLQDYARALVLEWSSHIKVCIEADQGEKEAENQVYDGPALDEPAAVLARVISEVIVALGADPTPLPRPVGAAPVAPPSLFFLSNTLENLKPQMEREAKWMEFGAPQNENPETPIIPLRNPKSRNPLYTLKVPAKCLNPRSVVQREQMSILYFCVDHFWCFKQLGGYTRTQEACHPKTVLYIALNQTVVK